MSWRHSICLACWKTRNPGREPIALKEPEIETCCFCGAETCDGIYVREDPALTPHCPEKRN